MIDHERCSELLREFVAGNLEPSEQGEVAEHLRSCSACSAEERALQIFMTPVEPLTELEAAAIRRDVLRRVSPAAERRTLGSRLAPYLGAAALLMIVAVGIVSMNTGGSDESNADHGTAEDGGGDSGAPATESEPGQLQDEGTTESAMTAAAPLFFQGGRTTERELLALGRDGYIAQVAATYASPKALNSDTSGGEDSDGEEPEGAAAGSANRSAPRDEFLDQMVAAAGVFGETVEACGQRALSALGDSALPVYGSATRLEGESILVLGFLVDGRQTYSRYSLWVFPRGSCDEPSRIIEGKVAR
jgi:hypothetical protein